MKVHLLTPIGELFIYIARYPRCTVKEIRESLFLSKRAVYNHIGVLKRAQLITFNPESHTHHYEVVPDTEIHLLDKTLSVKGLLAIFFRGE